jgi:serine/threonine-protein kinase
VLARFEREAWITAQLRSIHSARVIDVDRLPSGLPYIVLEYLEGRDLEAELFSVGPLPIPEAIDVVMQVAEAMKEAHALGIVHRDLKPANLFCIRRADGLLAIKVLDFGISKLTILGSDKEMTRTNAVLGSPYYMSPEQIQTSRGVDTRTDIWSLGVILFELVTGRVPFDAEAVTELVVKIATAEPMPIRGYRPDLPPGFDHLVMQCLEKDRTRRLRSVADLVIALRDYAPKRALGSVERVLRTMQAAGLSQAVLPPSGSFRAAYEQGHRVGPVTNATWGKTGSGPKKNKAVAAVTMGAGVLVVLAAATGGVVMMRRHFAASAVTTPGQPVSASASPTVEAAPVPSLLPSLVALPSPPPVESASTRPTISATATPAARGPWVSPTLRDGGVHGVPSATHPEPSCSPPFTIDPAGHRVPKPECM